MKICTSCIRVLFRSKDDYFEELCINFAKIIYQIMETPWSKDPDKPNKISIKALKRTILSAHGFDEDMLSLLYGTIGLISLNEKRDLYQ